MLGRFGYCGLTFWDELDNAVSGILGAGRVKCFDRRPVLPVRSHAWQHGRGKHVERFHGEVKRQGPRVRVQLTLTNSVAFEQAVIAQGF